MKSIQTRLQVFLLVLFALTFSIKSWSSQSFKTENDSLISALTSQVRADSVESYIDYLQSMGTRFLIAPNRKEVANSIANKFLELGVDQVRIDSFSCHTSIDMWNLHFDTTTWQYNVIGSIHGMLDSEDYYVMGAHYDDVVSPNGDPMVFAPGADDNASGVAALFESARIFSENDYRPMHTIEFVAFAAEELMYFGNSGAQAYVDTAISQGKNMVFMINNDMIAYTEDDNWKITISNYEGCEGLTGIGEYVTEIYTEIEPLVRPKTDQAGADAYYFYEAGVPCIYFMEEDFNPYYHTENDLVENGVMDYCAEAVKISIGVVLMAQDTTITQTPEEYNDLSILVYPNPSSGFVKVKSDLNTQTVQYRVSDIRGRILQHSFLENNQPIDLRDFQDGVYFLHIIIGKRVFVQKVILSKK